VKNVRVDPACANIPLWNSIRNGSNWPDKNYFKCGQKYGSQGQPTGDARKRSFAGSYPNIDDYCKFNSGDPCCGQYSFASSYGIVAPAIAEAQAAAAAAQAAEAAAALVIYNSPEAVADRQAAADAAAAVAAKRSARGCNCEDDRQCAYNEYCNDGCKCVVDPNYGQSADSAPEANGGGDNSGG